MTPYTTAEWSCRPRAALLVFGLTKLHESPATEYSQMSLYE